MDVCKKKRMRSQKGFGFLAGIDVTCYLEQAVGVMSMIQMSYTVLAGSTAVTQTTNSHSWDYDLELDGSFRLGLGGGVATEP